MQVKFESNGLFDKHNDEVLSQDLGFHNMCFEDYTHIKAL